MKFSEIIPSERCVEGTAGERLARILSIILAASTAAAIGCPRNVRTTGSEATLVASTDERMIKKP
jgi:hypothetical protein